LNNDSFTFFRPQVNSQEIFAHGRDPFFPAWTDTIQVNYFNSEAREFMINILLSLTELCDGVRCDMAMLSLNNVFENTWLGSIEHYGNDKPKSEFWEEAIKKVKEKSPEFIFIAEAYWDLEWELQQLGFDFTYDKRLLDRLESDDIQGIREHLEAHKNSQLKSVRFLENHDESRAITKLGKYKSFAATTIISTIQGMKLYYDGQFEGKKIKLPVQLGREPVEKVSTTVSQFYDLILNITKHEIFKFGDWKQLYPESVGENNLSFQNILTWQWKFKNEIRVIVINYSSGTSYCRLKFDITTLNENISLLDLMTDNVFNRSVNEIKTNGLFIELKSYKSHIFAFND
ncbi:MAG TPA: glycosidase, partial [Ignavibacteria bacterium]|nr:glycosidase [Ignavibacteria bacterium]